MSSDRTSGSLCDHVHQKNVMISPFSNYWMARSITHCFGVVALESACSHCWCGKFCTSFWTFLKNLLKYTQVDKPWVHWEELSLHV